jgi:hypothetical protein
MYCHEVSSGRGCTCRCPWVAEATDPKSRWNQSPRSQVHRASSKHHPSESWLDFDQFDQWPVTDEQNGAGLGRVRIPQTAQKVKL